MDQYGLDDSPVAAVDTLGPLRESLIRGRSTPYATPVLGDVNDGNRLQTAYAQGNARRRGRSSTSNNDPGLGLSPMEQAVANAKQQQQPVAQPPARDWGDNGPGSISITQGTGPDRMSNSDFAAWQQRAMGSTNVAKNAGGLSVSNTPTEGTYLGQGLRTDDRAGFTENISSAENQPADLGTDPIMHMVKSVQNRVDPQDYEQLKQFADSGAKPQQIQSAVQAALGRANKTKAGSSSGPDMEAIGHLKTAATMLRQQAKDFEPFPGQAPNPTDPGYAQWKSASDEATKFEGEYLNRVRNGMTLGQQSTNSPAASQGKGQLTPDAAHDLLKRAGGDKNKARQLARSEGWSF